MVKVMGLHTATGLLGAVLIPLGVVLTLKL